MKGLILVKDKETGEIYQALNVWVFLCLLNIYDIWNISTDKVDIYIDDIKIPRPEGFKDES